MSCNSGVCASQHQADAKGAPDLEAGWSENRNGDGPKFCPQCHSFLRKDGGCTRCENRPSVQEAEVGAPASESVPRDNIKEIAYDSSRYSSTEIAKIAGSELALVDQKTLAASPSSDVRSAVARSSTTGQEVLRQLSTDMDDKVALAAIRNKNNPYHGLVAGKDNATGPLAVVTTLRRKQHSWKMIPRCSYCGAWTKQDGVCNNVTRCRAAGKKMAVQWKWPPPGQKGIGQKVPGLVRSRLGVSGGQYSKTREAWNRARGAKRYPQEWRDSLVADLHQLASTGKVELAGGRTLAWNAKEGYFDLDGVPVHADSGSQAVRTAYAMMHGPWARDDAI